MAAQIATLRDISLEDVLEAKRKNIEEVLRHCHVLEHDFKYMDAVNNALCRTLVISFQWGKRELLNATGLGIPTF